MVKEIVVIGTLVAFGAEVIAYSTEGKEGAPHTHVRYVQLVATSSVTSNFVTSGWVSSGFTLVQD